jgi:phage terminase large subunit-like protein
VAALDEQGKVHHVGMFPELEDQMCDFVPGQMTVSPDRVDARVWGFTELMLKARNTCLGGAATAEREAY